MYNTTGYTMAVYEKNERGYEWYAGRYSEQTGQGELENNATRYHGNVSQQEAARLAILETGKYSRVEIVPWWN